MKALSIHFVMTLMLNIRYFKADSGGNTRPLAYRTPNSLGCQSPKSPNRLDHLVLVPWLNNIVDWAITVKANQPEWETVIELSGCLSMGCQPCGKYSSCHFLEGNLRTLFDLHLGHTLSRISCLGFTDIIYSCPQWRHFNDCFITPSVPSGL